MPKHKPYLGISSLSCRGDISKFESAILNATEDLENNTDLIDPEDSGLPLPKVEELSYVEKEYHSMVRQNVIDYTSAEFEL